MARYVSSRNTVSVRALKRKSLGSVVRHHSEWEDTRFTRVHGGWLKEREDFVGISPAEIVSSAAVAHECNRAVGCKESWARIY